jgi:ferrochelatase
MSEPQQKTGLLLVNLGSPSALSWWSVRRYLKQFLSDPRVVNLPRILWWLILHFFVLTLRPRKAAKAYRKIWTKQGSPLVFYTQQLSCKLARRLGQPLIKVEFAMRYGIPSIEQKLEAFRQQGIERYVILPMYPQYSSTTSASVFDEVMRVMQSWRHIPSLDFISDYHQQPAYIQAMADSIRHFWLENGQSERLILSFHGLPARLTELGDPYYHQCQTTATLIAKELGLTAEQWTMVFQSRFGKAKWLQPYCVDVLTTLPTQGITHIDIVCPGFAVDCLETLEEIAMANKKLFLEAGGKSYRYIPALNDSEQQIDWLQALLEDNHARL